MTKLAEELTLGTLNTYAYPGGSYDSTKLGLGSLLIQKSGALGTDNWAGPIPPAIARPLESTAAIPGIMPFVLNYSSTEDWIFMADGAAAAATRRLQLYKFNRVTGNFSWKGFVTLNFPFAGTQGTYTVRAFRMLYDKYTTGTASVSGTAVTGTGTAWTTNRIPVGCRIGFGSTNPSDISTWYEISAIGSNTGITLTTTGGTISDGPYVIEDLRAVLSMTNGTTATNGGLFSAKGLSHDTFTTGGVNVPAAVTTDSIRAVYWHTDAATNTNVTGFGMGKQSSNVFTTQYIYVLDTLANPYCFKFDVKAALTPTTGKDTNAFVLKTGLGGALTGTPSQVNNGRLANASHGGGSGLECLYFTTTTRVYRTAAVSTFTSNSTTWLTGGDIMTEVPPGGTATQAAFGSLTSIEYSTYMDKFIITTSSASGARHYVTRYRTDAGQMDRIFLIDTKQMGQSTASVDLPPVPTTLATIPMIWVEGGMAYMVTTGTAATTNFLYSFPIAADWEYLSTSNQRLILPKIATTGATKFSKASANFQDIQGGVTGNNLGVSTEGVRLTYRTSGIDDNSGSWTAIDDSGDISGVAGSDYIQFSAEFKTIGLTCLPSRLYSVVVTYETSYSDNHYQPSLANSNLTDKKFAWRFSTAWGSTVPKLYIRLYNAATGLLLSQDDSTTRSGTWEKSTDGGSTWGTYNTTDKANETTYIRYIPSSLTDNIRVRAVIGTS